MTEVDAQLPTDIDEEVDPRWVRSRTRLLDAAADLLRAGGIEAVTIDAVTKQSRVARTTLYRHFGCSSDLLAATLERLLPPITQPPSTGSLRDRLVELVYRQATLYKEAPLHLTTLAWLALRSNTDDADDEQGCPTPNSTLQARVVDHDHPTAGGHPAKSRSPRPTRRVRPRACRVPTLGAAAVRMDERFACHRPPRLCPHRR